MLKPGQRFGKLVVITKDEEKKRKYFCKCDCGVIKSIFETNLINGTIVSCTCFKNLSKEEYNLRATERFIDHVKKTETCWNWKGVKHKQGYGLFSYRSRYMLAHRVAWILFVGLIPEGMNICHKCDNTSCVNPNHLFLGTQKDNITDMFSKNRKSHQRENHPKYKMTLEIIKKIFILREQGLTQIHIGLLCGVCQHMVSKVLRKKHWLQQLN